MSDFTLPTADSWSGNLLQDLPWFVLILIYLQRWQHRVRNETKHFVSPHLIGPQLHQHDLASKKDGCANGGDTQIA